jgi:hypothetical protein
MSLANDLVGKLLGLRVVRDKKLARVHAERDALKQQLDALKSKKTETLFDGDDALFKEVVSRSSVYAEYGCGASTIWVADHTECSIYSVDSSELWITTTQKACKRAERLKLHFVDVGPVGDWGRPRGYSKSENFNDYSDWIWSQPLTPDVVLIDGRFRVCCFLTSLLNAAEGTHLVFDDYAPRQHYHFVEKFIQPVASCGRQAFFIVPGKNALDTNSIKKAIEQFRFVFE